MVSPDGLHLFPVTSGPQTKARLHIWPRPLNNTRDALWFFFQSVHTNQKTSPCQIERNKLLVINYLVIIYFIQCYLFPDFFFCEDPGKGY